MTKKNNKINFKKGLVILGAFVSLLLGGLNNVSYALPVVQQYPLITGYFDTVSYNSTTGNFDTADSGIAQSLYLTALDTSQNNLDIGGLVSYFNLAATTANGSVTGGFSIYNENDPNYISKNTPYLAGDLTALTIKTDTASPGAEVYDFLFTPTAGIYLDKYAGYTGLIEIASNKTVTVQTLYESNPVPEPSTIFLLFLGIGALVLYQRRKMHS